MLVIWSLFVSCFLYLGIFKFQLSAAPGRAGSYRKETSVEGATTTISRDKRRATFRRFDVFLKFQVSSATSSPGSFR